MPFLQVLLLISWKKLKNPSMGHERNLAVSFGLIVFLAFMILNILGDKYFVDGLGKGECRLGVKVLSV